MPNAVSTITKILLAVDAPLRLSTIREYIPAILSHRLQLVPHLRENGESKEALLLSAVANVPVPT